MEISACELGQMSPSCKGSTSQLGALTQPCISSYHRIDGDCLIKIEEAFIVQVPLVEENTCEHMYSVIVCPCTFLVMLRLLVRIGRRSRMEGLCMQRP